MELAIKCPDFFALLGIRCEGIIMIANGCRVRDPNAIPLAVALISTISCLVDLALKDKLIDPYLKKVSERCNEILIRVS